MTRQLATRAGAISLPAFIPVTTFGSRFPLDPLVRPYLPLLAQAALVSYPYAQGPAPSLRIPLLLDSGGFACLLPGGRVEEEDGLGVLVLAPEGEPPLRIHPRDVLELQERIADVAFTLDFPIPPGLDRTEARRRAALGQANARWALRNRRRRDLPLFAGVQGADPAGYAAAARRLAAEPFDGFAIGGLVPRARDHELVAEIARRVRAAIGDRPLHAFGLGQPELLSRLFRGGVDSSDSTSYLKLAADGLLLGQAGPPAADPSPTERLHLALCNLAALAGRAFPLSAAGLVFRTHALGPRDGGRWTDAGAREAEARGPPARPSRRSDRRRGEGPPRRGRSRSG
jgi:helicase